MTIVIIVFMFFMHKCGWLCQTKPSKFFDDHNGDNGSTIRIIIYLVSSYETRHQARYWGMVEVSYQCTGVSMLTVDISICISHNWRNRNIQFFSSIIVRIFLSLLCEEWHFLKTNIRNAWVRLKNQKKTWYFVDGFQIPNRSIELYIVDIFNCLHFVAQESLQFKLISLLYCSNFQYYKMNSRDFTKWPNFLLTFINTRRRNAHQNTG